MSFSLYHSDHVGRVGANGSGKSTLLKIIKGTVQAEDGTLMLVPDVEIGYLPQTLADADNKSVAALLAESLADVHTLEGQTSGKISTLACVPI